MALLGGNSNNDCDVNDDDHDDDHDDVGNERNDSDSNDDVNDYVTYASLLTRHARTTGRRRDTQLRGSTHVWCTRTAETPECVTRPVRPAEVKTNLKVQAAMQLEWDRLRAVPRSDSKKGVWDEGRVQ